MRLKNLYLHNVGPFQDCEIALLSDEQVHSLMENPDSQLPVVIFTGENGTGKSVVLDAIRTILSGTTKLERDIIADHDNFKISLDYIEGADIKKMETTSFTRHASLGVQTDDRRINDLVTDDSGEKVDWIVDYWSPDLDSGSFDISSLSVVNLQAKLASPFLKTYKNSEVSHFICFLDYLRGSDKEEEKHEGEFLYRLVSNMLSDCLVDGRFLYVGRKNLMPMVEVRGKELPIDKLSMGNLLLFNHFISTLYRMYVICERQHLPIEQVNKLKGVLLIDEIENHLHPKWQRIIISLIQKYFPHLQLIVTTHSPFVVNSVSNPTVYVCVSREDHSEIRNVSGNYSNTPVDEVLSGEVFGSVGPFGTQIAGLLRDRKKAIEEGRMEDKNKLEKQLIELNASCFGFMDLSDKLSL